MRLLNGLLLTALLAAPITGPLASTVFAEGPSEGGHGEHGMHGGARHGGGFLKFIEKLNFTEEQKTKAADIMKANRGETKKAMEQMFTARKNLQQAVSADEFNEQAVRAAAKEVAKADEELAVLRARSMSELRPIMTAEQKEQFAAMRSGKKEKFSSRREEMRGKLDSWIDTHASK